MRPLLLLIICCFSFFSSAAQFSPRFDTFGVDEGLSMNTVNDVVHDQQGYLWVATQAGLNRFDGKQFIQYNPKANGLGPSKSISPSCIMASSNGFGLSLAVMELTSTYHNQTLLPTLIRLIVVFLTITLLIYSKTPMVTCG